MVNFFFYYNFLSLFGLILLLLAVTAFYTLAERKLMGSMQRRKGPNVVGFWGLLQPMADGFKLIIKELIFPVRASILLFIVGPLLVFVLSIIGWIVIPIALDSIFNNSYLSIIISFFIGSLNIYGLILAGWASNSGYSFFGSIRATAQMLSYELILGMVNVIIVMVTGSFNYLDIIINQAAVWNIFLLFPVFILYIIVMLAETNRTPFDLAEAEAELVAGYNVEYSSMMFALFFLGEYTNMALLSLLGVIYFLGGHLIPFCQEQSVLLFFIKILIFCIFFVWVRATLPRYRYDQLMSYGWKYFLPIIFGLFFFYLIIFITFNILKTDSNHYAYYQDLLFYRLISMP